MKSWKLSLRQKPRQRIDARVIGLQAFATMTIDQVRRTRLSVGHESVELAEYFKVEDRTSERPCIIVEGDLSQFDHLASGHHGGRFEIQGNVGHDLASGMSGGEVIVHGDAGDRVGGPVDHGRVGMSGGKVVIAGDAGRRAGIRMRRGDLWINGDVMPGVGAWMIAGTIVIGGRIVASGDDGGRVGYGMRRGTIVCGELSATDRQRFTPPVPMWTAVIGPMLRSVESWKPHCPRVAERFARLSESLDCLRGDLADGGMGEIWLPPKD
ncbi:formylmethanofuran dehydrogenase subunit C [Crateriforma spongiae]|uniref:formylmethanofuran dehydrogenase subunit C n=1 Tax=Crateriforma spongiae TaxID=2724528 RepID=UPI00144773B8|nr:formylmethanofuran dehydrogenase subunit C [Crateriforma spongiae]